MQNKSILIVEDDNIIAFELQMRLEDNGYNVIGPYAYGEELIKDFDNLKADLILMDIHIRGELDGIQTAEIIKAKSRIPIIYLTAYADQITLDRAKITEPYGYIIKPFEERELFTNIQIALYRNEIEKKLIESEKNYRNIFNNSIEGIFKTSLDGKILQANPAFIKIFGYIDYDDLSDSVNNVEDDIWLNREDRSKYLKILEEKGIVRRYECQFKRKDNEIIWVSMSSQLIRDDAEKILYIEGFIEDITDRKKTETAIKISENKFHTLIENASEGIIIAQGTNLRFVNKNIIILTGYSNEELLNIPFIEFIHHDYRDMMKEYYVKRIKGEPLPPRYDIQIITKDGSYKWVEMNGERIEWENGLAIMMFVTDITDRKLNEETLLKLNNAIQNLKEVVFITDIEGIITYINPEFTKLYGHTAEEVIGKVTPRILKNNLSPKESFEYLWSTLLKKQRIFGEYFNKSKDGRLINIEGSADPIINDQGQIIGFIGIHRDISERKRSEKMFQDIIDKNPMSIQILDTDGYTLQTNLAYLKLFGAIAPPDYSIFKDSQLLSQGLGELFDRIKNGEVVVFPDSHFNAHYVDSSFPDVNAWIKAIGFSLNDSEGSREKIVLMHENITERKIAEDARRESEEKYRALVENSLEGVTIMDLEGTIIFANQCFGKLTEIPDVNLLIGQKVFGFLNQDSIKKSEDDFKNVINGIDSYLAEYEAKTFTGKTIWVESIGKQILFEGKPAILLLLRNITERKIAEESIQKQNNQIEIQYEEYMQLNEVLRQTNYHLENALTKTEESDRLKTAFLHNISHEIRTPLNEIIGLSTFLTKEYLNRDEISEIVKDLKLSSNRLIETINNIIDISKLETGQIEIENSIFSLNSMISDIETIFSEEIRNKNLELIFKFSQNEIEIFSDEKLLSQILSNLMSNAIKFTNSGFIEIGYEVFNNFIKFYLKDTGIGIALEHQSFIFNIFEQVDSSISRGYDGSGLGLSICRGIIKLIGGRIWFESELNKGSTFYFTIPINIPKELNLNNNKDFEIISNKNQMKILIVEDLWACFEFLNKVLSFNEFIVIHAENGQRAIDLVNKYPDIDLVLMDINMPIMDGFEATKIIKEIRPDLPIIAQTAYSLKEEILKIFSTGCDEYISKPIKKDVLIDLINKYKK